MSTIRKLRAISLFTGVGGMDFGFEAAGVETAVAVEMDRTACATMRSNRPWPLLEGDIHSFASHTILQAAGMQRRDPDLLIGGPPCQPWSKSGYWAEGDAKRLSDPRSSTLGAYLRVLRDTLPKAFVIENVHGLAFKGKDEGLRLLLEGVAAINASEGTNYRVEWSKLNAGDYGVPQSRERVFLVGLRSGRKFEFPKATHHRESVGDDAWHTAWDALGDLPEHPNESDLAMTGRWAGLLPSIPEGENYLWHTNRGGGLPLFGWRTRYWSFLLKLAKTSPSWTIQAQPGSAIGPFHWNNRRLSTQELCRLQTFPDGLNFSCGRSAVQKMLGNAVPSLLAEVVARAILRQEFGAKEHGRPKLVPQRRNDCPPPTKPQKVPKAYLDLIGDHEAHPGEGLGNRAKLRHAA